MPVLKNSTTGATVARNVRYARSWLERAAGFLPRAFVPPDDGLWFENCSAIHTIGMRAKIDVIFLDEHFRVLRTVSRLRRYLPIVSCFGAKSVVELGAGALDAAKISAGDRLALE